MHDDAIEALRRLRRRELLENGAVKEYYSSLSDIVRAYVEGLAEIPASRMTTEECVLSSARSDRIVAVHRALLGDFLLEADLVKFAHHLPSPADAERAWSWALRFVDETSAAAREESMHAADG